MPRGRPGGRLFRALGPYEVLEQEARDWLVHSHDVCTETQLKRFGGVA